MWLGQSSKKSVNPRLTKSVLVTQFSNVRMDGTPTPKIYPPAMLIWYHKYWSLLFINANKVQISHI